eukprot:c17791_g1_i2.p1 GENE.c17791_g1_i2~~c17791_g1_i2.p1  ORF type:complete len:175 (-),score=45.62 c17791_g1_i2:51-575(-)
MGFSRCVAIHACRVCDSIEGALDWALAHHHSVPVEANAPEGGEPQPSVERLLELEKKSMRWYSGAAQAYMMALANRLAAAPNLLTTVAAEVKKLELALAARPSHGSLPDAFLEFHTQTVPAVSLEDDGVEVVGPTTTAQPQSTTLHKRTQDEIIELTTDQQPTEQPNKRRKVKI